MHVQPCSTKSRPRQWAVAPVSATDVCGGSGSSFTSVVPDAAFDQTLLPSALWARTCTS